MKRFLKENTLARKIMKLVTDFRIMMFSKELTEFEKWMNQAKNYSDLKNLSSYIWGIERDKEAVKNSIIYDVTNGLTEGIVYKVKSVKKIMYNKCSFLLLRFKIFLKQNQPL